MDTSVDVIEMSCEVVTEPRPHLHEAEQADNGASTSIPQHTPEEVPTILLDDRDLSPPSGNAGASAGTPPRGDGRDHQIAAIDVWLIPDSSAEEPPPGHQTEDGRHEQHSNKPYADSNSLQVEHLMRQASVAIQLERKRSEEAVALNAALRLHLHALMDRVLRESSSGHHGPSVEYVLTNSDTFARLLEAPLAGSMNTNVVAQHPPRVPTVTPRSELAVAPTTAVVSTGATPAARRPSGSPAPSRGKSGAVRVRGGSYASASCSSARDGDLSQRRSGYSARQAAQSTALPAATLKTAARRQQPAPEDVRPAEAAAPVPVPSPLREDVGGVGGIELSTVKSTPYRSQPRTSNEVAMVSRLRRSLAPPPTREQLGDVVDAMMAAMRKDLQRQPSSHFRVEFIRIRPCTYRIKIGTYEQLQRPQLAHCDSPRCRSTPAKSVLRKGVLVLGKTPEPSHPSAVRGGDAFLDEGVEMGEAQQGGLETPTVAREFVVNLTIDSGNLCVMAGGGHVNFLEFLERRMRSTLSRTT